LPHITFQTSCVLRTKSYKQFVYSVKAHTNLETLYDAHKTKKNALS